jgi:hypothetical protein
MEERPLQEYEKEKTKDRQPIDENRDRDWAEFYMVHFE